jgi:FixJ family two-component response regulator
MFSQEQNNNGPLCYSRQKFAFNNSVHVMIGVSPFEVLYGYHSQMVDYVPSSHLKVQGVLALDTTMHGISGLSFKEEEF